MTNQQILEKAIQKARDSGLVVDYTSKKEVTVYDEDGYTTLPTEFVIFNHDFAKALWGEAKTEYFIDGKRVQPIPGEYVKFHGVAIKNLGWKHHLQMMVIAPDPIQYLGDNLL